jgi:hypothetical protein
VVLELARAGEPEGTVVVADHQTAGRGRLGRTWQAPPGSSLLVTLLLRPTLPVADVHLVTIAAALAAADAADAVAGVTRELAIERCGIVERSLPFEVLATASEACLLGTTREVQPITSIDGRRLEIGDATRAARAAFLELIATDLDP